TVTGSTLTGNRARGGDGTTGGNGFGGAIFNDGPSIHPTNLGTPTILMVLASTITDNEARGAAPGAGGSSAGRGAGGGISRACIRPFLGSTLGPNGPRGQGGQEVPKDAAALGRGLLAAGDTAPILDATIRHNQALGGDGDSGSNGSNGFGGGVYVATATVIV